ncbi:hypothetical protein FRC03_012893 [Tulasnella sp. 419]|nr:hypothetical protein FRC03_012893 [Tulasnella sp. 419]
MDSIEFRKWTKPSDFDGSQEDEVTKTRLEWVGDFLSPTPKWTVGAEKAKKDKRRSSQRLSSVLD